MIFGRYLIDGKNKKTRMLKMSWKICEIIHVIGQEMAMYDELSKTEKLKRDREDAKTKWLVLEDLIKEFKKFEK